jgi:hypothetical protein
MDSQKSDASMEEPMDEVGAQDAEMDMEDGEEVEITREELIASLQQVVGDLSAGLKGEDRDAYLGADDLAQNDWFFAGVSDEQEGTYSVTMWPAEGEEDMLRIDIGSEDDVHRLADNPEMIEAMTDDFIQAMEEGYDEDYEEYDEEEEFDDEELDDEELMEDEMMDDEDMGEDETVSQNGNMPPR